MLMLAAKLNNAKRHWVKSGTVQSPGTNLSAQGRAPRFTLAEPRFFTRHVEIRNTVLGTFSALAA
jgi:hypothetical protein